jgi:hypothetical protein
MKRMVVIVAVWALLLAGMPVKASAMNYGAQMGWGTLAFGATLFYYPTKLCYALLGGFTGGLAYGLTFGSLETANGIWGPSLGGTYVLTPEMLRGTESILFSGESHEAGKPEEQSFQEQGLS